MNQSIARAELRHQWREQNKKLEQQGKPTIPWKQWDADYIDTSDFTKLGEGEKLPNLLTGEVSA